jgi:histo-blood group ABO system transferase
MNDVVLVNIATGDRYWQYVNPFLNSANKFFVPHDTLLFTDSNKSFGVTKQVKYQVEGFPRATLMRYNTLLTEREFLSHYKYIFYSDIDMLWVDYAEDVLSKGITATLHPGFIYQKPELESNPKSTAYIPEVKQYYCGGFNGGTSKAFLRMAEVIDKGVKTDLSNGIIARWHDESHLNVYLEKHPPAKILSPSYCYPDSDNLGYYLGLWKGETFKPRLIALTKNKELQQQQTSSRPCLLSLTKQEKAAFLASKLKVM